MLNLAGSTVKQRHWYCNKDAYIRLKIPNFYVLGKIEIYFKDNIKNVNEKK